MCVWKGTIVGNDGEYSDVVMIFFVANVAQCMAFWASISLCGWAYPIPCHLY